MPDRHAKTLSMTPDQVAFLEECVRSGRYQSASEVVRAALRLLQEREERREAELERMRGAVNVGLADLDRGASFAAEDVFRDLLGEADDEEPAA